MNIIYQKWKFLNQTKEYIPTKLKHLYHFGISTFVSRGITSLRANARIPQLNWNTAKSKAYRLTTNTKIPQIFSSLLAKLKVVEKEDIVVIDFSSFGNGFQVLMFAKQTRKGRALPLYFEILRYPVEKGSQTTFVINAIKHFTDVVGCKPTLVFDRGFAGEYMVNFLAQNQYKFIIRIKKNKGAKINGKTVLVKDVGTQDMRVMMYDLKLRLVVSDLKKDMKEPWFLLTNDFDSSRKKIIQLYYHRFEIEEFFRDAKRLLGLEYINFQKSLSLEIILWFVLLTQWFFWKIAHMLTQAQEVLRTSWHVSIPRFIFELLNQHSILAAEAQFINVTNQYHA